MREIEFRAWLKEYQKMVPVLDLDVEFQQIGIDNFKSREYGTYLFIDFRDIELMQHTGLKDKNGVKIFEGDVFIDEDGCIGIVRYSEQFAWFIIDWYESPRSKEPIDNDPLGDINIHNMEVIGNIYENPELLEVEDE